MKSAEDWINELQLKLHPEGGFYREIYRSDEVVSKNSLPERYLGDRNFATSIYFLLRSEDFSAFHKICSDEIWFFHAGSAAEIIILEKNELKSLKLGINTAEDEFLQITIPKLNWFAVQVLVPNSYVLVSCVVAPAFDFQDFELADRKTLTAEFPDFEETINKFTIK